MFMERLKRTLLIYTIPFMITILYFFRYNSYLKSIWLLIILAFVFLIYCDCCYSRCNNTRRSIVIRKFYFTYYFLFLIFMSPYVKQYNFIANNYNFFGLSKDGLCYFILMIIGVFAYIFIISDSQISEITMGSTKVTMLKEKFEKDLDSHIDLTKSLIDKITAEYEIIQNLSSYCQEARQKNGVIVDEFQRILKLYYDMQSEKSQVFVVEDIDKTIKKDFRLKDVEFRELKKHMERSELYAIKTDLHYMFLPYIEESFEEILGEPLKLYIIIESEQPIIEQERFIILNILKEFYEKLLVNIYID